MEIWKDIPGYEARYQVSDLGRVRSLDRTVRAVSKAGREYLRSAPGVVLRPGRSRGYLIVNLPPEGTVAIHLLVACSFVAGFSPGLQVNHKDGDKTNNTAANLEWVTRRENQMHAVATGLKSQAVPVVHPTTGEIYPSISEAARRAHLAHRTVAKWGRP